MDFMFGNLMISVVDKRDEFAVKISYHGQDWELLNESPIWLPDTYETESGACYGILHWLESHQGLMKR